MSLWRQLFFKSFLLWIDFVVLCCLIKKLMSSFFADTLHIHSFTKLTEQGFFLQKKKKKIQFFFLVLLHWGC